MSSTKLIVITLIFFVSATPLHAYIDPGTGSMITQSLLAGLLAALFLLKSQFKKLISFFRRKYFAGKK
jgi:hypothetical protein